MSSTTPQSDSIDATLHFDGASRGNPGPSATGYALSGDAVDSLADGSTLGEATNNEAEYHSLIEGLETALEQDIRSIEIYGDSKLIINQVREEWDCNSDSLTPLRNRAQRLLSNFDTWSLEYIPRDQNSRADAAANAALDNANC